MLRTNQIKKFLISKNNDYFIHTEIHSVKDYRSCLWLDERCIFTVVCFQTLNWDVKKSQYIWNKIRTDWASVRYLVCTECSVLNEILIIYIWTQIHTDWYKIHTDSLVHCAHSFVCFLWFATCKWKIVRALFPWNNLCFSSFRTMRIHTYPLEKFPQQSSTIQHIA